MNKERSYYVIQIMCLLKDYIPQLILAIIVKVINMLMPYSMIIVLGKFVNQILGAHSYEVKKFIIIMAIILVATVSFSYLDTYISHDMSYCIIKRLRNMCYEKIGRLLPAVTKNKSMGDYGRIINGDVDVFEWFYAHIFVAWIATSITLVVGTFMIFKLKPMGILVVALVYILVVVIQTRHTSESEEKGYVLRRFGGELNATVIDGILGMKDVISNQFETQYHQILMSKSRQFDEARKKFSKRGMNEKRAVALIIESGILVATIMAIWTVEMTIGDKMTFILMVTAFFAPLQQTLNDSTNYGFVFGATKRVYDLLNEKEYVKDSGEKCVTDLITQKGKNDWVLALKDVHFTYPLAQKEVLSGISFTVKAGESVALVSASGGGKTTLVNLLQRFWDYHSGEITINGISIKDIKLSELRKIITVISQEIYIFNMTIRENLLMAKPSASEVEMIAACKMARVWDFIITLPKGLDTKVGERGECLSGGQRQRLVLAQAFLRDTPILVMDEATSNLDVLNEQEINQTIAEIKKEKVVIVVAHRLATISAADRIIFMESGSVVDTGSYESMIKQSCHFRQVIGLKSEVI